MKLTIQDYQKSLPRFDLRASFWVEAGERVALLGPSGSGKTTLLRFLAGLDLDARGKVWSGDQEVTRWRPERRDFGVCFQNPALFTSLNVLQNVVIGLEARKMPRAEREARGQSWLQKAQMSELAQQRVENLSGGEAQRVALLRVLAIEPVALLLDEPFSSLDTALRAEAREWVLSLTKNAQIPLLFVTHDTADVDALATRVLKIEEQVEGGRSLRQVIASR